MKDECGNCIHYMKPECPRDYPRDIELWRAQQPCEIYVPKGKISKPVSRSPNWCPNCERETDWLIIPSQPNLVQCKVCRHVKKFPPSAHEPDKASETEIDEIRQVKEYEEAIKKLAILFAKGEISQETYKTSVQSLEEKIKNLKQTEKETEISEEVGKSYEPTVPKITATHIIVGVILLLIFGATIFSAIFYLSTPRTVRFTIRIESDTNWAGSIGADGSSRTIESYGSGTWEVTGTIAVAVIQKHTEYGYLKVSILRDGEVLDSQTTNAAFGVVSVSASG